MTTVQFNSLFPVMLTLIAGVVILCLLSWLEIKRKQKWLGIRILALLVAIFSLGCLILNPAISVKKSSTIIVLTPGFSQQTLDSLLHAIPESQLYKLKGVAENDKAIEIENYRKLGELHGNFIFLGEGIQEYILEYVDTSSVQFYSSPVPVGVTAIDATKTYTTNQKSELAGMINPKGIKTLKLIGPGITEDSITLEGDSLQRFSLKFTPKTSGLLVYTITSLDSLGNLIGTEQVPVRVKEQKSLSILFLKDYPSAEIRFLKNFLGDQGHKLTLRYKISKAKYRTEFVNTPQKNIGTVNEKLLQNFDLVITDVSSLALLSGTEIRELKGAMKSGLGVLTGIDGSTPAASVNDFLSLRFTKMKGDSANLLINSQRLKVPATPVGISSERKIFPVQHEPSGRIVSGYYQMGLGKLAFQLLASTYSLQLSGEKEIYAILWSRLVEAVARRETIKYDLSFTTPFPHYEDEPVEFKIVAAGEKPSVKIDSADIQLIEDPIVRNVWYGKIWAGYPGFNQIQIAQDSSQHSFFVSSDMEWRSLRTFNQQKNLQKLIAKTNTDIYHNVYQPISRSIILILFLLSAGFLWLAPKL